MGFKIDNNYAGYSVGYREPINFSASITDIAGVYGSEVNIACNSASTSSCSSYTTQSFDLIPNGDYFSTIVSDILPVGNYTATFRAWDIFNNYNETILWFLVEDNAQIDIILEPNIQDYTTIYFPDLNLAGRTSPEIQVDAYICDNNCLNCGSPASATNSGSERSPKDSFKDVLVSDLAYAGYYPSTGNSYLVWNGDLAANFDPNDFLKFSDHDTFYEVTNMDPPNQGTTLFNIDPSMQKNVDSQATVSAYEFKEPTGWFELPTITLTEGHNCIKIVGTRTQTGNYKEIFRRITYSLSGLNITQVQPYYQETLYDPNLQSITIRVTTDFPANCSITNPSDNAVAKRFTFPLAPSSDRKTHSIVFGNNYCTNQGTGPFCYLNNDASTSSGVLHTYTVNCVPYGVAMGPDSANICFSAATWYNLAGTDYGLNICDGATGCSGSLPSACTICTPSCIGKLCGDNGCGGSCGPPCPDGTVCQDGQCGICVPNCAGRECGDDDCGGSCGPPCPLGETCQGGTCAPSTGGEYD